MSDGSVDTEPASSSDCTEGRWSRNRRGYCVRSYLGKMVLAHRVAYCEHHGLALSDIDGKVVRHTCDHPPCINPAHLLLGTQSENMDDMTSRHRARNQHGEQTDLETARQIRALYVPGSKELGCRALARKFGISKAVVSRIVNNLICKEQV